MTLRFILDQPKFIVFRLEKNESFKQIKLLHTKKYGPSFSWGSQADLNKNIFVGLNVQ